MSEFVISNRDDNVFAGLADLLSQLKELLQEYTCDNKDELLLKFDLAVDALVAIDIKQIPDSIEDLIDAMLATLAKSQARRVVARICPEDLPV